MHCHARQKQLVERADLICKEAVEEFNIRGTRKVFEPLASAKQISMEMWRWPDSKEDAKGRMVPKMVGFEGLRMEIPHPDAPLARWRINLRGCLSYTILVTCPDIMSYSVNKEWMDMQCIGKLENFQIAYHLSEGTIPANVFAVAITHFTARALDEGPKASQSMEEGEQHVSQIHENVESWGLRPRLLSPKPTRMKKVLLLTDSGALIYQGKKSTSVKPENCLNNDECTHPWKNIITSCESGAGWAKWAALFRKFVAEDGGIIETCPDGKKRFPSHVTVIVIDNLNGSGADYAANEENMSEEKRTSMTKFLKNVEMQAATTELMELVDCFKSAVYCQTAPAKHWGMTPEVDKIADYVREKAREKNIATLDATQFWPSFPSSHPWGRAPWIRSRAKTLVRLMMFTGTTMRLDRQRRFPFTGTGISSGLCAIWKHASSTSP